MLQALSLILGINVVQKGSKTVFKFSFRNKIDEQNLKIQSDDHAI